MSNHVNFCTDNQNDDDWSDCDSNSGKPFSLDDSFSFSN